MTREGWIEAGVRALVEGGIANVKIQTLARRLSVSRSSFYWFFSDLESLHRALLDHWLRKNTDPIIEHAERSAPSVTAAVCGIFECWVDPQLFDPRLDAAVRAWAQVDPDIRAAVDHADDQRVDALARMFQRYGYPEVESFIRARILYFTQIGHFTLGMRDDIETRLRLLGSYLFGFTGCLPTAQEIDAFEAFMRSVHAGEERLSITDAPASGH